MRWIGLINWGLTRASKIVGQPQGTGDFIAQNDWIDFLAESKETRSNTSVCLKLDLNESQIKQMIKLLENESVAFDIGATYRDAPAGLRILVWKHS